MFYVSVDLVVGCCLGLRRIHALLPSRCFTVWCYVVRLNLECWLTWTVLLLLLQNSCRCFEQRTHKLSTHTDVSCSGHGSCVSTAKLFQLFGLSYGNVTTDYIKAGGPNWDAFSWHHCLCSANLAAGFLGDPLRPSVGPRYVRTCCLCALCRY
jgi:hypothetical protein